MATQRIKLKKDVGPFKSGKTINATADELRDRKLTLGKDYDPLGTYPHPVKSDLASPETPPEKADKPNAAKPPAASAQSSTPKP